VARTVEISSLFTLGVKVVLESCTGERACKQLPPPVLHYLMYRAVIGKMVSLVQELVRFWPTEMLSFDFEKFFVDHNNITGDIYLRRYHSWFHSPRDPSLKLTMDVAIAVANGLYLRCCDCGSELPAVKQLHVDLSMVGLGEYLFDEEDKKQGAFLYVMYLYTRVHICIWSIFNNFLFPVLRLHLFFYSVLIVLNFIFLKILKFSIILLVGL